jgi:hypothetical protein
MSLHGRAAIRWEKVLYITKTEPENVTQKVTITVNSGGG